MKIQNALVSNILDRSQRYFAHVTTVTLSWRVQNIVVIGRVHFTLECFEFSSNFEFDRNMLSGTGARTDSAPLFLELGILSVFKLYMMKLAVVTFKSYHRFSIESIKELFTEVENVHDRDARQSREYHVPFTRNEIVRKSFKYRTAKLWNHLFDILEINCSVACFKHYVKSYLTNNDGLDMLDSCLL